MKIILGSVVKGYLLKSALKAHLSAQGHEVLDVGCYATDRFVKFSSIGQRVAYALSQNPGALAINCCGSGTGASISTGKFKGVCAVSCESPRTAALARAVNDANCLALGEAAVSPELACQIADAFIAARFQDAPGVSPDVLAFWKEARDELIARGDDPAPREIETL